MKNEYVLSALNDFVCLAGDCPDTCCSWDTVVDAPTADKWNRLPPGDIKTKLLANVEIRVETGTRVTLITKTDAGRRCAHLDAGNLCRVHAELGHEYLPEVCRSFPRIHDQTALVHFQSATLACPEIARLVMFGDHSTPTFKISEPGAADRLPSQARPAARDRLPPWLATFSQETLAHRKYPLNIRLVHLARILGELSSLDATGGVSAAVLDKMTRGLKTALYDLNLAVKNGRFAPAAFTAGSYWRSIYAQGKTLVQSLGIDSAASPLLQALESGTPDKARKYGSIYEAVRRSRRRAADALKPYDLAFERCLSVSLMNHGFPWNPRHGNYIAAFLHTTTVFALVRLALWLQAGDGRDMTPARISETVYKAERHLPPSGIYAYLDAHPDSLRIEQYFPCLIDLG